MAGKEKGAARAKESFWRRHGLSLVLLVLFAGSLVGQVLAGRGAENAERREHGEPLLGISEYVRSPGFVSATFENWESEFLQMGVFVLLTVWLREAGSAESRPLDPAQEKHPRFPKERWPWPARRGGAWRRLYATSLSLAFFALFALSFAAHLFGSLGHHNAQQREHGEREATVAEFVASPQFWFESFQNWQSEFASVLAIVLLSVWLRQEDSPQSKPVEAPHDHTGH